MQPSRNVVPLLAMALIVGIMWCGGSGNEGRYSDTSATYVGGAACYSCRLAEEALWSESYNDLAYTPLICWTLTDYLKAWQLDQSPIAILGSDADLVGESQALSETDLIHDLK